MVMFIRFVYFDTALPYPYYCGMVSNGASIIVGFFIMVMVSGILMGFVGRIYWCSSSKVLGSDVSVSSISGVSGWSFATSQEAIIEAMKNVIANNFNIVFILHREILVLFLILATKLGLCFYIAKF